MHSNHTLLDTTIEGYAIEDFVYSCFHVDNAQMPRFVEDVVSTVQSCKQEKMSSHRAVEKIREVWGNALGYIFTAKISKEEIQLVHEMFADIP